MYNIYKITTKSNGKIYVGQTKRDVSFRLAEHKFNAKSRSHCDLHNHISEFGIQDLTIEILEICEDTLSNDREKYWISELDSTNPEKGYNRAKGGRGNPGLPVSEETRLKLRKANKGFTVEAREKIRQKAIGRKLNDIQLAALRLSAKKISKKVSQYDRDMNLIRTYDSILQASIEARIDRRTIQRQLNGEYLMDGSGRSTSNIKYFWKLEKEA